MPDSGTAPGHQFDSEFGGVIFCRANRGDLQGLWDARKPCMHAGMNDYVTKPMSPQALAEALEKWLPKAENTADSKLKTDRPPFIIILTSKGDDADIIAGLDAGANDYLSKPLRYGAHPFIISIVFMLKFMSSQKVG
jgi:CheY-like chemotaxis protein